MTDSVEAVIAIKEHDNTIMHFVIEDATVLSHVSGEGYMSHSQI